MSLVRRHPDGAADGRHEPEDLLHGDGDQARLLLRPLEEVVLGSGGTAGHDACVAGGGGLGLQVVGEDGLQLMEEDGCEAGERDPGVVSDAEDLALVWKIPAGGGGGVLDLGGGGAYPAGARSGRSQRHVRCGEGGGKGWWWSTETAILEEDMGVNREDDGDGSIWERRCSIWCVDATYAASPSRSGGGFTMAEGGGRRRGWWLSGMQGKAV